MKNLIRTIFFGLACVFAQPVFAQDAEETPPPQTLAEVDAVISDIFADSKFVGATVALADSNGVVWSKGFGYLDEDKTHPATADSLFRAGSISKAIVGIGAMVMVEDGMLDMSRPLREVAPDIQFQNKWQDTNPVLLAHLLEHTTGWDDLHFTEYRSFAPDITFAEGLAVNPQSRTSRWRPGYYMSYSNSGPAVMGEVMQQVSGISFDDFVTKRIFEPLNMDSATFYYTPEVEKNVSGSFDKGPVPYAHIWARPSGSLVISANDLAKLVPFFLNDGAPILSPDGIGRIERAETTLATRLGLGGGYGFGNGMRIRDGGQYRGHNGAIDAFSADFAYNRAAGMGYVVMYNSSDSDASKAIRNALTGFINTHEPPREARKPVSVSTDDLKKYEGYYRDVTPRIEFTRLLGDIFEASKVNAVNGTLEIAPATGGEAKILTPAGNNQFFEGDDPVPLVTFAEGSTGIMELVTPESDAKRRVSMTEAYMPMAIGAAMLLTSAVGVLLSIIWIFARPFGAFRHSNRWRVWTFPLLAFASFAGMVGTLMGVGTISVATLLEILGSKNLLTFTIFGLSLLGPLFAVGGVWAALTSRSAAWGARIPAGVTSIALVAFSALLFNYGWIGLTVWAYNPAVMAG